MSAPYYEAPLADDGPVEKWSVHVWITRNEDADTETVRQALQAAVEDVYAGDETEIDVRWVAAGFDGYVPESDVPSGQVGALVFGPKARP